MRRPHLARACMLFALGLLVVPGRARAQPPASPDVQPASPPPAAPERAEPDVMGESAQRAVPEPASSPAAALFAEGAALFRQWRFDEAEEKYREALSHKEHPVIYLYLSRTLEKQGKLLEAHDALQHALRQGVAALPPEDVEVAEDLQANLEARLAQIEVHCDVPSAEVLLDGEPWFVAPDRKRRMIAAGQHVIVARKHGYFPVAEPLSLFPGKQTRVVLRMAADVVHIERRWQPWRPWTVAGAGMAASLAGGLFLWQARSDFEAFQRALDSCEQAGACDRKSIRRYDRGVRYERLGIGALAAGGAILATGLAGVLLNQPRTWRSEPAGGVKDLEIMPLVSGDAVGISTWIRF